MSSAAWWESKTRFMPKDPFWSRRQRASAPKTAISIKESLVPKNCRHPSSSLESDSPSTKDDHLIFSPNVAQLDSAGQDGRLCLTVRFSTPEISLELQSKPSFIVHHRQTHVFIEFVWLRGDDAPPQCGKRDNRHLAQSVQICCCSVSVRAAPALLLWHDSFTNVLPLWVEAVAPPLPPQKTAWNTDWMKESGDLFSAIISDNQRVVIPLEQEWARGKGDNY